MNPLETYLRECGEVHGTGAAVPETSYYPALSYLFNEIGKTLKPKVRCIINLANRGKGLPDGGFFTPDQIRKSDPDPMTGNLPARGAIEAKPPTDEVQKIVRSEQVERYIKKYGLVLVTNLRDFLLVGRDEHGATLPMEGFVLAASEKDFWALAAHPRKAAKELGERFCEYLRRVMLSKAPLKEPQDLAWFLASYARDAKSRVESHRDLSALNTVRTALEEALGMKFTGEKGDHFFRSTLVQTLFYGVFSAWVLWHREKPGRADEFNWKEAGWLLRVPFIRTLYEQVATPGKLGSLDLVEVLDWTAAALNRVDREAFFQKFQDEHAVQYFYEPFLEAFDPELRKDLGVWYTPPEIVQYQVARVDTVLREELGLADGLADENVVVLDPCCGTGAYLVEVLKRIAETLRDKGGDDLIASDLKKAAMTRVFGFEILPAPFVVAHLQLGLMLRDLGAPLSVKKAERVGVYLTNSLTGWEPPKDPKKQIVMNFMQELQEEKDKAEKVKQHPHILVVLGNPPYNAKPKKNKVDIFYSAAEQASPSVDTTVYKKGLNTPIARGGWGIKKFNLDDLYIRFFRLAERRIAEMSGKGVVSFISSFSYLGDPSFVVMRQRLLSEFDKLWFDCMNGDSRETGKLTPEGKPDPSVFSTDQSRVGIRVGTAVCVMVRKEKRDPKPTVYFRHFWGVNKRQELLDSLQAFGRMPKYEKTVAGTENRYSARPENVSEEYNAWPKLPDLCEIAPSNGLMEKRGGALIDIERDALESRMKDYFDKNLSWDEYKTRHTALTTQQAGFNPPAVREKIKNLKETGFQPNCIMRYTLRPLETCWCYYTQITPLWNRPRPALWKQCFEGNAFLLTRPAGVANPEGAPLFFTRLLGDNDLQRGHSYYFPIRITPGVKKAKKDGFGQKVMTYKEPPNANLSSAAREYLAGLGITNPDVAQPPSAGGKQKNHQNNTAAGGCATQAYTTPTYDLIWMHALAVGYSPAYLAENTDGIRRDWPRVPLPDSKKNLEQSAALGRQVAALLDTEKEVAGITAGKIEPIFKTLGVLKKVGGGSLNPDAGDLAVTAGWGHAGKGGVTMPGRGQIVERPYTKEEMDAIAQAANAAQPPSAGDKKSQAGAPVPHNPSKEEILALLGATTYDVYLNYRACWCNVPANVWEYYIGGYQVIKKWLSYREETLLGRSLKSEEAREVAAMVRRLAAIVLLQPALDANYRLAAEHAYSWPKD